MKGYITVSEAAERMGMGERRVQVLCCAGELSGAKKTDGEWLIPETADERLAAPPKAEAEMEGVAAHKRDRALWRLGVIEQFEKFCGHYMRTTGGGRCQARDVFCATVLTEVSERTLKRWEKACREHGVMGLVDARGGVDGGEQISAEAWEEFKSLWLSPQQRSVRACRLAVLHKSASEELGWQVPSSRTLCRYIEDHIPYPVRVLYREGKAAYEAKCAPYVETDPDSVAPGAVWVGDHHQLNIWIRERGNWVRPWITAWEDKRSRCITGWWLSASPNQTTILQAFRRGIDKYGPPDAVKIDNGRDYDSQLWTGVTKIQRRAIKAGYIDEVAVAGIYAMLDISVSFAIPYNAKGKPVERWFDTLDCQFSKFCETYCGKDSARKPEDMADLLKRADVIARALDFEGLEAQISAYIGAYNASSHTGAGMEGRSPDEVLNTRQSVRALADGVAELLLKIWSPPLTIGKNGVTFRGVHYGQYDAELLCAQGRQVRLAYDPDDLSSVDVYDAATWRLLTIAEAAQLVAYGPVGEEHLRQAMRQKARAQKILKAHGPARRTANTDTLTLAVASRQAAAKDRSQEAGVGSQEGDDAMTLRPVNSPLNDQVRARARAKLRKEVRVAAGAEGTREVLNINLSALAPEKRTVRLELFSDG